MLVFDLDPSEGVAWDFVIETALRLRRMLQDEGLEPWPKLTGGKGLHLMAPLEPKIDHDEARAYARRIAQRLPRPHQIATRSPQIRDNARGTSPSIICGMPRHDGDRRLVAASPGGFPIAAPVSWRDVENGISPDAFSIQKLPGR